MFLAGLLIISELILFASCHSHLECTNLVDEGCHGYSRYYSIYKKGFENSNESKDRNFITNNGKWKCPEPPAAKDTQYTEQYPMAKVYIGQKVTIQWPPRGHLKQNHSPVWIYCDSIESSSSSLIATLPYDNCKGADVSWAKCTGSFRIPKEWKESVKSCKFVWTLNNSQTYVDCFEYEIMKNNTMREEEEEEC
jgi:hypothetical protein